MAVPLLEISQQCHCRHYLGGHEAEWEFFEARLKVISGFFESMLQVLQQVMGVNENFIGFQLHHASKFVN